MKVYEVSELIQSLGLRLKDVKVDGVDMAQSLVDFSAEGDKQCMTPEPGVEVRVLAESKVFIMLGICLRKMTSYCSEYLGELPEPFAVGMSKQDVRAIFGLPQEWADPFYMPVIGETGGWDSFVVQHGAFAGKKLHFNYLESLVVSDLVFIHHE